MMEFVRRVAFALSLVLLPVSARAEFCMLTQNGLHLGQGKPDYRDTKRQEFQRIFRDYDVVTLQEVMDPDEPARLAPAGFSATVSAAKGASTYKEHYAVLTRDDAITVLDAADYPDDGSFARPPFGVAVQDKHGGRFWLVDIHAIFGKGGVGPRRLEVAAMAEVLAHYAARLLPDGSTVARVVVAGDWNLPASDHSFADLSAMSAGLAVAPNVKSSLNGQGAYSSPYDHFLWNATATSVAFADEPRDTGGLDTALYRTTLSDHVGVAGYVMAGPGRATPNGVACPPSRSVPGS
ncbi:MAG TPA: endonuclease/exonuclease/phosphatase family protein [Magnetospirillum sp.]|nr:endonuclease/exonuclease/phosphatase family protein [Magnetospirillum sp.]